MVRPNESTNGVVGGTKGIGAAVSSLARRPNFRVLAFSRGGELAEGLVLDAKGDLLLS